MTIDNSSHINFIKTRPSYAWEICVQHSRKMSNTFDPQRTLIHYIKISFVKAEQTTAQATRMIDKIDRPAVHLLSTVNH